MMQPLSSLNNICSMLQKEEIRRNVMHGPSDEKPIDHQPSQAFMTELKPKENTTL